MGGFGPRGMTVVGLYIGIDGGGSSCRARIETEDGAIIGRGLSGPATMRLGIEKSWGSIMSAVEAAISEAGLGSDAIGRLRAGIGIAGFARKGAPEALNEVPHPFASCAFTSDGMAACLGAHGGADGGVVIAGTGSIAIAMVAGDEIRAGGYGFPISDEGSGADIGLRAVRLALRAWDGRVGTTPLLQAVMQVFEGDPSQASAWLGQATPTDYATFAPMVMRHAAEGDAAAVMIASEAGRDLDGLILALLDRGAPQVSLLGGLAAALTPFLAADVRRRLKPAQGDAVTGAILFVKNAGVSKPAGNGHDVR
jgi:glucosamine kinase